MKGIIFKAFEDFVVDNWGEAFYEGLLDDAALPSGGVFVGPGTYPDAELFALVGHAVARLGVPLDDALGLFGRYAFAKLAASMPGLLAGIPNPRTLLGMLDSVIHVEVRKLHPQAETPRITVTDTDRPDTVRLVYSSERQLCPLLMGLVRGLADHYGCELRHRELACMRQHAPHCEFEITF